MFVRQSHIFLPAIGAELLRILGLTYEKRETTQPKYIWMYYHLIVCVFKSVLTLCLCNDGLYLCPVSPLMFGSAMIHDIPKVVQFQRIHFVQLSSFALCVRGWVRAEAVESFAVTLIHVGERDGGVQNSLRRHLEILFYETKKQVHKSIQSHIAQ